MGLPMTTRGSRSTRRCLTRNVSRHTRSSSSMTSANGCSRVSESRCPPSAPRCGVPRSGGNSRSRLGLRHPDIYGAVFSASPGGGYQPPAAMPSPLPRVYLVAGTLEPFFLKNATRWAVALRDAGADVVMTRAGRVARRRVLARRVSADGGVGVWTLMHGPSTSRLVTPSARSPPGNPDADLDPPAMTRKIAR